MKSKSCLRQARRLPVVAIVSAALAAAAAAGPARAADDGEGSVLGSLMQIVGLKDKPQTAAAKIDYRERAPLVLPKTMDLPPPARSAGVRNPAWPKDPDVVEARKAADLARAPHQDIDTRDGPMPVSEMAKDRIPANARTDNYRTCEMDETQCDPHAIWAQLRIKKGDPGAMGGKTPLMVAGKEPPREYLTEPPPGYLAPTQVTKRSWEQPENRGADDNANVYWMHQAGHNVTVDDPSDED